MPKPDPTPASRIVKRAKRRRLRAPTSEAAFAVIQLSSVRIQDQIVRLLADFPDNAEGLLARLLILGTDCKIGTVRNRLTDLIDAGLVVRTDHTRANADGLKTTIYDVAHPTSGEQS